MLLERTASGREDGISAVEDRRDPLAVQGRSARKEVRDDEADCIVLIVRSWTAHLENRAVHE